MKIESSKSLVNGHPPTPVFPAVQMNDGGKQGKKALLAERGGFGRASPSVAVGAQIPLIVAALNSTESAALSDYCFGRVTSRPLGNLVVRFYACYVPYDQSCIQKFRS